MQNSIGETFRRAQSSNRLVNAHISGQRFHCMRVEAINESVVVLQAYQQPQVAFGGAWEEDTAHPAYVIRLSAVDWVQPLDTLLSE